MQTSDWRAKFADELGGSVIVVATPPAAPLATNDVGMQRRRRDGVRRGVDRLVRDEARRVLAVTALELVTAGRDLPVDRAELLTPTSARPSR